MIYTLKIGKLGYKLLFAPTIRFEHDCEIETNKKPNPSIWRWYYLVRNHIELLRELAGWIFPFALVFKMLSWIWGMRCFDDKSLYFKVFCFAVTDGLKRDFSKDIDLIKLKFYEK